MTSNDNTSQAADIIIQRMMNIFKSIFTWPLEKVKTLVEIIAILTAGVYALMTWGLDEYRLRQQSWFMEIGDNTRMTYFHTSNDTVFCDYKATFKIHNLGKTPMYIEKTNLTFYFQKKPTLDKSGFTNSSLSHIRKTTYNDIKTDIDSISHNITIDSVDDFPVPARSYASRPFHIQIDSRLFPNPENLSLKEILKNYILLIEIHQEIYKNITIFLPDVGEIKTELGNDPSKKGEFITSPALIYYDPDICDISKSQSNNEEAPEGQDADTRLYPK